MPPPQTDRLFARIRAFDLECPNCADVFVIDKTTPAAIFTRRHGRFTCPRCRMVYAVGVILYPVTRSAGPQIPPPDWTPTPRQALALRQGITGHLAAPDNRKGWKDPHNVVIHEKCTCLLVGRALVTHPTCPVHSAGAARASSSPGSTEDTQK